MCYLIALKLEKKMLHIFWFSNSRNYDIYIFVFFVLSQKALTEAELDVLLGLHQHKTYEAITRYVQIEPEGEIITKYDDERTYMDTFWETYKDEVPDFNALDCMECRKRGKIMIFTEVRDSRRHAMTHFEKKSYIRFNCPRCYKNYGNYKSLLKHASLNQCFLTSNFPPVRHFVDLCLEENPQQDPKARDCSRCGLIFRSPAVTHDHFVECIRFPIVCPACETEFTQYKTARIHFETDCDGTKKSFSRYYYEKLTPPPIEDREGNDEVYSRVYHPSAASSHRSLPTRRPSHNRSE
jgi:hypothetical protein